MWLLACALPPVLPDPAVGAARDTGRERQETGSDTGTNTGTDTGPDTAHPAPDPQPALTAEQVGAALEAVFAQGFPDPVEIAGIYQYMLWQGDDNCPGPARQRGELSVFDPQGCLSASGYRYQGAVGGSGLACGDEDGDGRVDFCMGGLRGDGSITDPGQARLLLGGYGDYFLRGDPLDGGEAEGRLYGTWGYPGAAAPWLRGGVSAALEWSGWADRDGIHDPAFTGGYTLGEASVELEVRYGAECGGAPAGRVGLRGEGGYWYDLIYDPATCDRCGDVVFNSGVFNSGSSDGGIALGRGCADPGPAIFGMLGSIRDRTMEALGIPAGGP